jgi:hypothetical protein
MHGLTGGDWKRVCQVRKPRQSPTLPLTWSVMIIECTMVDLAARMNWTGCTSGSATSSRAVPAALAIRAPATVPVVAGLDLGHSVMKDAYMTSETNSAAKSGQESVVLASFDSYRHAEHMLASLGRKFRKKARKGGTIAVVVTGNTDGSLKLTQSRVLTASDFAATLIRISLSWTVGFMGLFSTLKGAKSQAHAAHVREGHAGSQEHRAHWPACGHRAGSLQGPTDAADGRRGSGQQCEI